MQLKRLLVAALTIVVLIGGTTMSASAFKVLTREEVVDQTTDALLYSLHPDLNYRKLRSDDYGYIQEWQIMRSIIDQHGLAYQELNPRVNDSNWYWKYDDESLKERLADAIFYHRHPERGGNPIQSHERQAIREWQDLKQKMWFPTN
jgi:hypothetical protein